jgi:hypothetical protein
VSFDLTLLVVYRLMALVIAGMMVWVLFRERDWTQQVFAAIVLVPIALRAAGVK